MTPPKRVFVPGDSAAVAVGADAVAAAFAARGVETVRTSSRGAFWLEPLVEIETEAGRIGFGPFGVDDVDGFDGFDGFDGVSGVDAVLAHPRSGARCLGRVDAIPFLARQRRLIFARAGVTEPLSLADYAAHGGWQALRSAATLPAEDVRAAVLASGLRGRGGAAFPAGIKWRTVAGAAGEQKHVVCNADEGDSGTYADRMVMEGDPYLLVEGMAIAGLACGATRGFVYVRSEYPAAIRTLRAAIGHARAAGFLGPDVAGSGHAFELEVRVGAGSYVCGEETAMLESLEGRRGLVRAKPPVPALRGLFGRPTLIQNVLTFAAVPWILVHGAAAYAAIGSGRSTGTMPFQLAGNVRQPGLVELPFGVTLRELVVGFGGGTASGRPVKAIQVGGPLGTYLPESQWDVPLDIEAYASIGGVVGHGGIVVHDDTADLARLARFAMQFCAIESCGKCTPCRIGSVRGVETIDRLVQAPDRRTREREASLLRDLCDTMVDGSLCAMGGMTPYPVRSALAHWPGDFGLAAESAPR